MTEVGSLPAWARAAMTRPLAAAAALLAVYLCLTFVNDPGGTLGTDTGGKVATLEAMERNGGFDPDVGYWAERWDPDGRLHPLYYTSRIGERWVNATTLPALYAALPLYRLGGYRLALLVPAAGAVAAAWGARRLARDIGAGDGTIAFWVVGLASPMLLYALDFWEHSLGVAVIVWAVVHLHSALEARAPAWRFAVAGALFGLGATMRTETLVYAAVAGAAAAAWFVVMRLRDGTAVAAIARAALPAFVAFPVALVVPLAANLALEHATVGGAIRSTRTAGSVTEFGVEGGSRAAEAAVTAVSLEPSLEPPAYLIGATLLALVVFVAVRSKRPGWEGPVTVAVAGVAVVWVVRMAEGAHFVPGLFAAAPIAAFGLVAPAWRTRHAIVGVVAVASLPLVWLFQYRGGAYAQWGGRYLLASGALLTVLGVEVLRRRPHQVRRGAIALSAVVTAFGLAWMVIRTHDVGRAERALARRPEPVLVSTIAHLAREGGALAVDRRWLTVTTLDDLNFALDVLDRAGITRFALVEPPGSRRKSFPGWRATDVDTVRLFSDYTLTVTSYRAPAG